ncbi:MAG TPA: bacteriohopanetetrol glucosamine biosynthesis glycosyltransferase HpnI, partial [Planctomycetaceae bacterium]|nr:bacteriohopanetetrol glucosamine biosynthesis glycosyltransferase HpnI [Planctomycetaceae bacterium]
MVEELLIFLVLLSAGYWIAAWWAIRRFLGAPPITPTADWAPRVSVLKPLKGVDTEAYQNFASYCRQDYPDFELLFGVADEDDPAVAVVRQLQQDFPDRSIRLIVVQGESQNPKCATLIELTREARGEVFVISDSDIRVPRDYLVRVVAPLADRQNGLVTCLYRNVALGNLAARLESLYLSGSFMPNVVLAHELVGVNTGIGATLAVRREDLARAGGYESIADYQMDDYWLAHRISGLGLRLCLSDCIVENVLGAVSARDQWSRETRWARGLRVTRPGDYLGLVLTFTTPIAFIELVVSGGSTLGWCLFAAAVVLRYAVAASVLRAVGQREISWSFWLLPVRDLYSAFRWCVGLVGRRILWRGQTFVLRRGGRLQPASEVPAWWRRLGMAGVKGIDSLLRLVLGVHEYSRDADCLFRVSLAHAHHDTDLKDGTHLQHGDELIELHYWNDHLPPIPHGGPDLAWGMTFHRGVVHSLEQLADYVQHEPRYQGVKAVHADFVVASANQLRFFSRMTRMLGLEFTEPEPPRSWGGRLHAWGDRILRRLLAWTFNPNSLRNGAEPARRQLWISRHVLLTRYGHSAAADSMRAD